MVKKQKKYLAWGMYIPVLLGIIIYSFITFSFNEVPALDYGLFLLLAIGVALFPIRTNDSVFSLTSGVSLATFVIFGLVPEILLSSIALFYSLFRANVKWDQHHRYALNLLMTAIMSIVSAGFYVSVDNVLTYFGVGHWVVLPMLGYIIGHIISNQLVICLIEKYYYKLESASFFNIFLRISITSTSMIFPLSFILLILYLEMRIMGLLIGAVPFMTVTIGMKFYYKSKSSNQILKDLNNYSQRLTSKLSIEAVVESFIKYIFKIFPSEKVLYFKATDKVASVVLEKIYYKDGEIDEIMLPVELSEQSISKEVLDSQTIRTFSRSEDWHLLFTEEVEFNTESAVILPVNMLGQSEGLVVISHHHQAVYDEFLVSLIEIFYQYFLVVLLNARSFERLEISNVTDFLTNLPNLRGFTEKLREVTEHGNYDSLSVIVMDLDYFKSINDEHGHEAGNDVLKQVANILKDYVTDDLFVARYGGEEFILFLKDYGKHGAYEVAEEIRQKIEGTVFRSRYSITEDHDAQIRVTASLGIATYPEDCNDLYDLVNLADRVMYLNSKRSGRNIASEFIRES